MNTLKMKKIILIVSKVILIISCLNIFAFTISYVQEGQSLGFLTEPIKNFYGFPRLVKRVFKDVFIDSDFLLKIDADFVASNNLDYDVYALNGRFEKSKWIISLTNLRDDSVINEWYLRINDFHYNNERQFSHAQPKSPILLNDQSLILKNERTLNLYRIDKTSKIIWHNTEHELHHSMNLDRVGNIWVCTSENIILPLENVNYEDNFLTKIDAENGQTLYHKSLTEILVENDLIYLIHGLSLKYGTPADHTDPFHLNDIEPALNDGLYWKADDLFISLRHKSVILLYRPSTNKIIKIIQGPFINQHDVDILSDSTISIFNNNASSLPKAQDSGSKPSVSQKNSNSTINKSSQVLVYNFKNSTFTSLYPNQFVANKIFTQVEGLHHLLTTGDLFVESTKQGQVFIFNNEEVLLKKYSNQKITNNRVQPPYWIKIYENIDFLKN